MSTDTHTAAQRFDELLPFYVNGTLESSEREWVDAYLREHPQAAGELAQCRALQQRIRADVPAVSSEVGLDRAMSRIVRDRPAPQRAQRLAAAEPSLFERLSGWFSSLVPQPVLKPAFAAALAVVAVQGLVIVQMARDDDERSLLRGTTTAVPADTGPYLKVNFRDDAREAEIRLLLVEASASLAAGPGQLGDYYLRVPAAQAEALAAKLRGSAIIDAVAVVDALPPRQ